MATSATKQVQETKAAPATANSAAVTPTTVSPTTVSPTTVSSPDRPMPRASAAYAAANPDKKLIGYGMPCSRCHAYYPADMTACPICKCPDRVSPTEPVIHSMVSTSPQSAAGTQVDAERELLLKELKSQAFASHTQINPAATFQCVLAHQHTGPTEPAAVCHTCYSEVRQQADRFEAALHIDVKDAARIVYAVVWADTSAKNASYFNAATALITEIHKRAGIGLLLGSHQPMAH